jgi:hypothetical protein
MKRAAVCILVGFTCGVVAYWWGFGVPYIGIAIAAGFTIAMEATA